VTPYELRFQGFSTELARVLERMVNAKDCYIVKSIAVDKAPTNEDEGQAMPMMDPRRMNAYSRYGRYAPQPVAPVVRRPTNVLLDESKLLVIMEVDAVRLKTPPPSKARSAAPRVAQQ
jgi:hypothetical protein